jgi:hypothetical protein
MTEFSEDIDDLIKRVNDSANDEDIQKGIDQEGKLQDERNNNSNNNGNGNGNGKAKGKSKSKLQQHQEQEQEQKRRYTAYKYSQNSKSLLHKAVILAGRPALCITVCITKNE